MLYQMENQHGGDVYGGGITLDFSANTNPLGTPPGVLEAVCRALPQLHRYSDPYCRRLVQAIAGHEQVPASYILCGNGAADLIYTYCAALRPRTAVEPAPTFAEYGLGLAQVGCRVTPYFLHQAENFDVDEGFLPFLEEKKPEVVFLCNPNNPTGRILHKDEADILEAFMLRHPQVYMLSDEVYEKLVYDGAKSISMGAYPSIHDRVATMNGFSKSAAMTGWRMGYLAAPKAIYDVAYKLYQHSLSCMSGFLQKGAVEAFSCEYETEQMRKTYAYRRDMFTGALNKIPGVRCLKPEGAFYAWVFFDIGGMDSTQMCEYLLENAGVVGMPGSAYGEETACCMRFSFANATEDLERAAQKITDALLKLQQS